MEPATACLDSMTRELEGQKGSWGRWKGGCGGTRPEHEEATAKESSKHMAGVTVALKRGAKDHSVCAACSL